MANRLLVSTPGIAARSINPSGLSTKNASFPPTVRVTTFVYDTPVSVKKRCTLGIWYFRTSALVAIGTAARAEQQTVQIVDNASLIELEDETLRGGF